MASGLRKREDLPESGDFHREKAEVKAVLESATFSRTPTLSRFLSYVCERHFQGQQDQIKEYNIAVEALGRPAEFNPDKDSVVRVEAYRLRKRLRRYYQTEGAGRLLEIVIPQGRYLPNFVPRESGKEAAASRAMFADTVSFTKEAERSTSPRAAAAAMPAGLDESFSPPDIPTQKLRRRPVSAIAAGGAVLLVGLVLAQVFGMFPVAPELSPGSALVPAAHGVVRILAGSSSGPYADTEGRVWMSDRFSSGGRAVQTAAERMPGGWDEELFRTHRMGDFRYDIPLAAGSYELSLHFSEKVFGPGNPAGRGEVSRLFDVLLNGQTLLDEFDILADAGGPNIPTVKVFRGVSPAADGFLHLEFRSVKSEAALSAIELQPMSGGRGAAIRILPGRAAYIYSAGGERWGPDRYFDGGQSITRQQRVSGAADANLYTAERYGNFTYTLPVAQGTYKLTLGFAETWWGKSNPGGGGAGSRVFHVYSNGAALLENFDILKESGGENRVIEKVFRNIKPNAQGKVVLSFVPVQNYACVNLIALEDEAAAN